MEILVCIKQVGDNGDINRFDAYALEEALELKKKLGARDSGLVSVDVVTVGPPKALKMIRRAFGMGADRGYHIVTEDTGCVSSFVTASRIAAATKKTSYDLILTGMMSGDMMEGQTGPMLANIMGFPCATGVVKTCLPTSDDSIEIEREMENGFRDCLVIRLPVVLTIQAGINTPRYPNLSNMLAAGQKEITNFTVSDLSPEPVRARQFCIGMEYPEKTRSGKVLEGSLSDKAEQVFAFLKKRDFI